MNIKNKIIVCIICLVTFTSQAKAIYVLTEKIERKDELLNNFIGEWEMKTVVTKSNCPYVIVGSSTISKLEIKEENNEIKVAWSGGSWSDSNGLIKPLSTKEAILERTTRMFINNKDNWKAELFEHLFIKDDNKIHSESIVKQYKNNAYVGDYKTYSVLSKVKN